MRGKVEATPAGQKRSGSSLLGWGLAERKGSDQIQTILTSRETETYGVPRAEPRKAPRADMCMFYLAVPNPVTQTLLLSPFHSKEHKNYLCFGGTHRSFILG